MGEGEGDRDARAMAVARRTSVCSYSHACMCVYIRREMQLSPEERWGRVAPALLHRSRRWEGAPMAIVEAFRRFAQTRPPIDVGLSVLRSLAYAWTANPRYHNPVGSCYFCDAAAADDMRTALRARSFDIG